MRNRLAFVLVLSCMLLPGLAAAGTGGVEQPAPAVSNPAAGPECGGSEELTAPAEKNIIAELFQAPVPASCTCLQARKDCDNYCWLSSCVVGSFSCNRTDPCNSTCVCQC